MKLTAEDVRRLFSYRSTVVNKTGHRGVFRKRNGRFLAYIKRDGKMQYLGTYSTAEEAHIAHVARARELSGEFVYDGAVS